MYYIGIDLLKIIAMLFITVHHILGHGGVLTSAQGVAYNLSWFIETMCLCGVNCYAIISGFLGYGKKHRISRYLMLWFQVVFYCLIITIIFFIIGYNSIYDIFRSFLDHTHFFRHDFA